MSPESSSKIGKTVGEKLRAARIAQRYTQSQLAAPDFSVSYISAIERGQIHPSLRALEILAGRLGLSSTQLLPNRSQVEDPHGTQVSIPEREEDEMELALLEAHIQIWQGNATETIAQLKKLSTKRLKRQQQLQHRYLLGWAYLKVAQFQECEYTLSEAIQLAKDQNAQHITTRILNLLALAYAAMRNYQQAILTHQRCLHMLETNTPRDPFFTAQVYMHIGQHYTHLDNLEQALEMFNKALEIIGALTTTGDTQTTYLHISRQYAESKDYALAIQYAYKCLHLSNRETNKQWYSELYHYLGQALLKSDLPQTRLFLDEALQREQVKQDSLAQASIYTTKAKWYFAQQELAEAKDYACQALQLAQLSADTIIGAETYIVLGHIYYALERHEQADQHFATGLGMLGRLDLHEELADESVRYAQLLETHGKEREAFAHFRQAFQSRQKIGK
jgi:tetratricopeptide (TPR) repeat protein